MHEHDCYNTNYPTNFPSKISGRGELSQLTKSEVAPWGVFFQHAGEEMLEYLGQVQGQNLSVGPTLDEAGL